MFQPIVHDFYTKYYGTRSPEHYFKLAKDKYPEFDFVVDTALEPWVIVTAYLDTERMSRSWSYYEKLGDALVRQKKKLEL